MQEKMVWLNHFRTSNCVSIMCNSRENFRKKLFEISKSDSTPFHHQSYRSKIYLKVFKTNLFT